MGVCSRREADRLIEAGKVLVDGEKATAGMKVTVMQLVVCDGKPVGRPQTEGGSSGRRGRAVGAESFGRHGRVGGVESSGQGSRTFMIRIRVRF